MGGSNKVHFGGQNDWDHQAAENGRSAKVNGPEISSKDPLTSTATVAAHFEDFSFLPATFEHQ